MFFPANPDRPAAFFGSLGKAQQRGEALGLAQMSTDVEEAVAACGYPAYTMVQCLEERDLIDALIDSGCTPFVWPQKLPIAAIDPEQGLRVKSISALKRSDQVFGERTMALHLEEESLVVEGDALVFWTLNAPP